MQRVYFIGIGGIGMSALARYYKNQGFEVYGSDNTSSEVTLGLEEEGIKVFIGADVKNFPNNITKIIYTIAIPDTHPEFVYAKELEKASTVSVKTYPEALGELTKNIKTISVCGTHGKTTTTAMVYHALKNAGVNISMIVGSFIEVDGKKTNYLPPSTRPQTGSVGGEEWMVVESCEYRRSFLNYNPEVILVTNVDNDHLDYFKSFEDVQQAFQEFVSKLDSPYRVGGRNEERALIVHEDENYLKVNDINVKKINCDAVVRTSEIELSVPGLHNKKNAQLVVALGDFLRLDRKKVLEGLKNFQGTWRRQEYKGNFFGADFYDDYAHHPTEIRATLQAFREKYSEKKILTVFQPHLFSRTKLLFNEFAQAFFQADEVVLLPIYASREKFDTTINSEMLVDDINKAGKKTTFVKKENLKDFLESKVTNENVVITLGAGDVYEIYKEFVKSKS
jgi:UDP-N-acetylmuramate--alanine ligase